MLEDNTKKKIDRLASTLVQNDDALTKSRIKKADFDKTLIGTVIGWKVGDMPTDNAGNTRPTVMWLILANNTEFKVWQPNCDVTSIGQQVRLYYPNNDDAHKYAEVINKGKQSYMSAHPNKCVYDSTDHTITETWALNDGTFIEKLYTLQVTTDQQTGETEVTRLDMPDGTQIVLDGFVLNNFS